MWGTTSRFWEKGVLRILGNQRLRKSGRRARVAHSVVFFVFPWCPGIMQKLSHPSVGGGKKPQHGLETELEE